jgi:hypothetical protein
MAERVGIVIFFFIGVLLLGISVYIYYFASSLPFGWTLSEMRWEAFPFIIFGISFVMGSATAFKDAYGKTPEGAAFYKETRRARKRSKRLTELARRKEQKKWRRLARLQNLKDQEAWEKHQNPEGFN